MKITKQQLKQIIKEELSMVFEAKEEHIAGISSKIDRLRDAIESAEKGMQNMEAGAQGDPMILMDIRTDNAYWAKQVEISNLNDKITLLLKQLRSYLF